MVVVFVVVIVIVVVVGGGGPDHLHPLLTDCWFLSPMPVIVMVTRYSITSPVPPLMWTGKPLSSCNQRRCEGERLALPGFSSDSDITAV